MLQKRSLAPFPRGIRLYEAMADFLKKRLQVFVSSTFSDLKAERQAAVEAILSAGHIPAGMELFTAGDESQMEVIKQWIDESDVYMLILGGRYGSVEPNTGKSYTQLEYEYAIGLSKPFFACVIREPALEDRVKKAGISVLETENPQKLRAFRLEVLGRVVRFWDDAKDIKIAVGETLSQLSRREDLVGWVRPVPAANMPALADEIARLSKENAELRSELSRRSAAQGPLAMGFEDIEVVLKAKGLLGFLEDSRLRLASGWYRAPRGEQMQELIALGLVDYNDHDDRSRLTPIGAAFLNALEVRKAAHQKLGPKKKI